MQEKIANHFSRSKNICILGFGKEGQSTLAFLQHFGVDKKCNITIHDGNTEIAVPTNIQSSLGDSHLQNLETYDCIIKTAGIPRNIPDLSLVQDLITTQTELFFQFFQGHTIAVTGTKGKSTTTSLIQALLHNASYDSQLIGNIGVAPLSLLCKDHTPQRAVLELSSYQLHNIQIQPTIGIVLSLYHEHHIPWHGGEQEYYQSKLSLLDQAEHRLISDQALSYAQEQDLFVHASQVFGESGTYTRHTGSFHKDSHYIADDTGMLLQGVHNRYNACAALGVCDILQIPFTHFQETLAFFGGLEHRLEKVGTYGNIERVNDAISTTPESTIAALEALGKRVTTIFLGGKDGKYDFSHLISYIAISSIKNIVFFPDNGKLIETGLPKDTYTTFHASSMKEAVNRAAENTDPGTIALLSCASPSYSLRSGFEEKGTLFKKHIKALT